MKTITKKYLEEELNAMLESNAKINAFASISPFGNAIDMAKAAEDYLKKADSRIRVQIWQKHRIEVIQSLLEKLS